MKTTDYDRRYLEQEHYWGNEISKMAISILNFYPAKNSFPKVLEIGCGEGTNAVFLAKNGYKVTAFDLSKAAIAKTNAAAALAEVHIATMVADINDYLPTENFDIVFSSGTLQYLLPEKRPTFIESIKAQTTFNGVNVLHTFANKPFLTRPHDAEDAEFLWQSGELLNVYQDWRVERFVEEVKSCHSGGIPHEHSHNRIWVRKI